jgi:hypothetical protein
MKARPAASSIPTKYLCEGSGLSQKKNFSRPSGAAEDPRSSAGHHFAAVQRGWITRVLSTGAQASRKLAVAYTSKLNVSNCALESML